MEAELDEFQIPAAAKNISKTDFSKVRGSTEHEKKKKCKQAKEDFQWYFSSEYDMMRNQTGPAADDGRKEAEERYYECFPEHSPAGRAAAIKANPQRKTTAIGSTGRTLEEDLYTKE